MQTSYTKEKKLFLEIIFNFSCKTKSQYSGCRNSVQKVEK